MMVIQSIALTVMTYFSNASVQSSTALGVEVLTITTGLEIHVSANVYTADENDHKIPEISRHLGNTISYIVKPTILLIRSILLICGINLGVYTLTAYHEHV